MKNIAGQAVCETLEELVDPAATALVLVDFQNDFVGSGGVVARRGEGGEAKLCGLVDHTAAVVAAARERAVTVVYVRYARTADHRFESAASLRWTTVKRGYTTGTVSAVEGTWGAEIVSALAPKAGDIIIDKRRASGFFGTSLEELLRARDIRTLVLAGVSTHGCVEATARDAELQDYYVVLLEDCTGAYSDELHDAALIVMRSRYEVVTSGAVIEAWSLATDAASSMPLGHTG